MLDVPIPQVVLYRPGIVTIIGVWERKHRGGVKLVRFRNAEAGTEIKAVTVDEVTGAQIGAPPIRAVHLGMLEKSAYCLAGMQRRLDAQNALNRISQVTAFGRVQPD